MLRLLHTDRPGTHDTLPNDAEDDSRGSRQYRGRWPRRTRPTIVRQELGSCPVMMRRRERWLCGVEVRSSARSWSGAGMSRCARFPLTGTLGEPGGREPHGALPLEGHGNQIVRIPGGSRPAPGSLRCGLSRGRSIGPPSKWHRSSSPNGFAVSGLTHSSSLARATRP